MPLLQPLTLQTFIFIIFSLAFKRLKRRGRLLEVVPDPRIALVRYSSTAPFNPLSCQVIMCSCQLVMSILLKAKAQDLRELQG